MEYNYERYYVELFVWNDRRVTTCYWLSGKFGNTERMKRESWLYEYRDDYADVSETLCSNEARTAAEEEGKH